jgi:hypothetical protein
VTNTTRMRLLHAHSLGIGGSVFATGAGRQGSATLGRGAEEEPDQPAGNGANRGPSGRPPRVAGGPGSR